MIHHEKNVLCNCYRPDGRNEIYSGSDDRTIVVWESDDKFHFSPSYILKGHKKSVSCVLVVNGRGYLVSGSDDKTIRVWDIYDGYKCIEIIDSLKSEINCLRYNKNRILAACVDGNINFISLKLMRRVKSVQLSNAAVYDFDVLDKEKYLLIASYDCKGRIWGIGTDQRAVLEGHYKPLTGIVQLKNGDIVTSSLDCTFKVWEINAYDILAEEEEKK